MTGRSLSVVVLAGSLSTLVLVATFAGADDSPNGGGPSTVGAAAVVAPAWTRFRVRPTVLLSEGLLSEGLLSEGPRALAADKSAPEAFPLPTSRAIYRYVRDQAGRGRVVLASHER